MIKKIATCFIVVFLTLISLPKTYAAVPSGFTSTRLFGNLGAPTSMAFAPDGRLFFNEKGGKVRIIKNPGGSPTLVSTPFLSVSVNQDSERGLLGIAFDPNFSTDPYVYIYYTKSASTPYNQVSRFRVSASNPDIADSASETVLLRLDNLSAVNHNGGGLHFGVDGKLYIATGENQIGSNSQSLNNYLGKILRINKDGSVPTDNPFYTTSTDVRSKIWALGFRNPFTFDVHPTNGTIFVNDVGNGTWEEIDKLIKGANYGWPNCEGNCSTSGYTNPVYSYNHNGGSAAIAGGAFYEASQFPSSYKGKYFYADSVLSWIKVLDTGTNTSSSFGDNFPSIVDLKVGPEGYLYAALHWNNNSSDPSKGEIYKIYYGSGTVPTNTPIPTPTISSQAPVVTILTPSSGSTYKGGDTISYSGSATDPQDGTLPASSFTWQGFFHHDTHTHPFFGPIAGSKSGTAVIPTANEVSDNVWYRIVLTVTDSSGLSTTVYRDILPQKVTLTINTIPTNLQFSMDGQPKTAPFTVGSVVGMRREIGSIDGQTVSGFSYGFKSWSDGLGCTHFISTPSTNTTYTLTYAQGAVNKVPWGDSDCNGTVNWTDFMAWITNYAMPYTVLSDFDSDGKTTTIDFARFAIGRNLP